MKISNFSCLLFGLLFCIFTVNCNKTNGDDKIKLKIEVLKKDDLLSPDHLKVQKNIMHNGKKINIKVFEKINKRVLERAFVVEEVDKTHSLTKAEQKELMSLRKVTKDSEEEEDNGTTEEDNSEEEYDSEEEDSEMKVVSSEESMENDVYMLRKVYKENKGNKEIIYCYMMYTFNLDLEKLNEVSRSELFKSLDSTPDYLSFLSPKEDVSEAEKLLEEEYEHVQSDSTNNLSHLNGVVSAAELSHDSEDIQVSIRKYITTLDDIINYVVSKAEDSNKLPGFYKELLKEREYLYKLSLNRTKNENVVEEEYWKNKSKIDQYFLYEALTNLKNVYFRSMRKRGAYNKQQGEDHTPDDSSLVYDKFVDLTDKTIKCHALLDATEILDFVILQNMHHENHSFEDENESDKETLEDCVTLFKILLHNKDDLKHYMHDSHMEHSKKQAASDVEEIEKDVLIMDTDKNFDDLENVSEENVPTRKYMLRKEPSDDKDTYISVSQENAQSKDHAHYDAEEETFETDDASYNNIEDIEEAYELDDESEESDTEKIHSETPEKRHKKILPVNFLQYENIVTDISNGEDTASEMFNEDPEIAKETEEEHKAEILEVLNLEKQKMMKDGDMHKSIDDANEESSESTMGQEMTTETPETELRNSDTMNSMKYDNNMSEDTIATEMFNEDPEVAEETEDEHKAEILEVLNLEKQKMMKSGDMNKTVDSSKESENGLTEEIHSETPEMGHHHHTNFMEYDNMDTEISSGDVASEMFNEDPTVAEETDDEHKAEILEVLNLEKQKMMDSGDMNKTVDSSEESEKENVKETISETSETESRNMDDLNSMKIENEISSDDDTEMEVSDERNIMSNDISNTQDSESHYVLKSNVDHTVDQEIKPHNDMISYLENESLAEDDAEDDNDDDDSMFSVDDNDEGDIFSDDSNEESDLEEIEEEADFDENITDDDDDDGDDNDGDDNEDDEYEDEDEDEDEDENEEEKEDKKSFTKELKKSAKKGLKGALDHGKKMAKGVLSNLVDEAGSQVNKLTSNLTNKLKNKLSGSKDKKKSKKDKKNGNKKSTKKTENKKAVKKSNSKGIKKDKKKNNKNSNVKKGNAKKTTTKTKKQGKSPKAMSSLEIENNRTTKLRKLNRESSFIGITDTDTSSKQPITLTKDMKNAILNISSEMSNLEKKKKNLLKKLEEPRVSDEKVIEDFEKYFEKEQKKKDRKLKK